MRNLRNPNFSLLLSLQELTCPLALSLHVNALPERALRPWNCLQSPPSHTPSARGEPALCVSNNHSHCGCLHPSLSSWSINFTGTEVLALKCFLPISLPPPPQTLSQCLTNSTSAICLFNWTDAVVHRFKVPRKMGKLTRDQNVTRVRPRHQPPRTFTHERMARLQHELSQGQTMSQMKKEDSPYFRIT